MRIMNVPISSISELKKSPMDVIRTAAQSGNGVYILNRNKAVAVVLTPEQYESLVADSGRPMESAQWPGLVEAPADNAPKQNQSNKGGVSKTFIIDLLGDDAITAPKDEKICRYIETYARETKEHLSFIRRQAPIQFLLGEDVYKAELRQSMRYGGSNMIRCRQMNLADNPSLLHDILSFFSALQE